LEWTGSLGGGGRVSGVNVGGAADAASGGFCHNWLFKKTEGAQGIVATAKDTRDSSKSSQKRNDGKINGLLLLLLL